MAVVAWRGAAASQHYCVCCSLKKSCVMIVTHIFRQKWAVRPCIATCR